MSLFDAILFDAGGVLVVPDPKITGSLLADHGGTDDEQVLVRAHFAAVHAMDRARAEGMTADWEAYRRRYVREAGVAPAHENQAYDEFSENFDHWVWCHPVAGARDALSGLAARGVPIGIVSNAGGQVEDELAQLGIARLMRDVDGPTVVLDGDAVPVSCVVDSHLVGIAKPDPAIFAGALDAIGQPASERIAYVGDTVFYDVRAAAAAGLSPLLHDPFGFHVADPHPSGPHRTLDRLADLLDLV